MNDDMRPPGPDEAFSDEQFDTVAAVLDGVASDVDGATVTSTPMLQALLVELRADRESIRSITVSPSARTAALVAAMDEFDQVHLAAHTAATDAEGVTPDAEAASAPASGSSNVVRLDRRRRQYRVVIGAAAAVAVLFVGVALTQGPGGGRDDEMTAIDPATANDSTAIDSSTAIDGSGRAKEAAPTMADAATGLAEAPAAEASTMIDSIDGGAAVVDSVADGEALRSWAAGRPAAMSAPGSTCIADSAEAVIELGTVLHLGSFAVVVRTVDTGLLTLLDPNTCATLLEASP